MSYTSARACKRAVVNAIYLMNWELLQTNYEFSNGQTPKRAVGSRLGSVADAKIVYLTEEP
jgi:hypothetical protein